MSRGVSEEIQDGGVCHSQQLAARSGCLTIAGAGTGRLPRPIPAVLQVEIASERYVKS